MYVRITLQGGPKSAMPQLVTMECINKIQFLTHKLEGAQRVHISAKYTIICYMLSCTRLHVYIRASLVMFVRSRRLPTIMTSSTFVAVRRAVACAENPLEMALHFCTFLLNPHFDLEPDYIVRKPMNHRFQRYIVHTEISSTFHARVKYISVKTCSYIRQNGFAAMTSQSIYRLRTDTQKWKQSPTVSLRSLGGYNKRHRPKITKGRYYVILRSKR